MNKQIRNKHIVLLIGIVIAVISAIMAPVSANNNSLNIDCMTNINGVMVAINCEQSTNDWTQNAYSESDLQEDPC